MAEKNKYNYNLPAELIAKTPANPRDYSRLLVFDPEKEIICHELFYNLKKYLKPGDLLVTNDSKVMPSRIIGKKETGGEIEVLLLGQKGRYWNVLIGGKIKINEKIIFNSQLDAFVLEKNGKNALLNFNLDENKFWEEVNKIGKMPIPPYIKDTTLSEVALREEYQTVYAKRYGSAAAPTAGLHFTKKLLGELQSVGVEISTVDLSVGLGTFAPLEDENIKSKKLHLENFSIPHSTIKKILFTKKNGGRIIAVGTTTIRALESAAGEILSAEKSILSSTDIFIQPGDKFQIVDGLITNFHMPQTSLMMLVAAFLQYKGSVNGQKKILELYQLAIDEKYRFYSFGDAMFLI